MAGGIVSPPNWRNSWLVLPSRFMLPRLQMQSAERDCGFPIRLNVASSPMGCPQQVPRLYRVRFGCQIVVESRGGLIKLAMFHEVASLSDLWIWRPSNLFLDRFIH